MKVHPKNYYYLFQLGTWGLFMTYESISYTIISQDYLQIFLNSILNFGLGILITHVYRSIAIRRGWLNLALISLIPRALMAMLISSLLMTLVNIPLDHWMFSDYFKGVSLAVFLSYLFNWSKYIAVWFLSYHLYILHVKSLREKVELVSALREIEFNRLKNQLNPHFLFNALNSIRALVDEEPAKAKEAITLLSELLRRSLKLSENQLVPFEEEVQAVESYLQLEKIRYEERLQYQKNIEPETLKFTFPPMILQTLVENGIKHGIARLRGGGLIAIRSYVRNRAWCIEVASSGKLDEDWQKKPGIGIKNTQERLSLLYGSKASFQIQSSGEDTVVASIRIEL